MLSKYHTRRSFLRQSSIAALTAAAPMVVPSTVLGRNGATAPSDQITLGVIGTGDHGVNRNIKRFLPEPDCRILAVCDVDRSRRLAAKALIETRYAEMKERGAYNGCDDYNDFREILERTDIDAVMNATPDHWHVIPSIMAARAGKDVMCEKPLSLTVIEGRLLADAMKKYQRVFQTATENRSDVNYHRLCTLVRNGRIGKLKEIRVGLPGKPGINKASMEIKDPPEGFDYDMWLGQAPVRPYSEARCHWNFRWIMEYSGGQLTDWGAHMIDLAQWGHGTEQTGPVEIEGKGKFPNEGLYDVAHDFIINYTFADGVKLIVESKNPYLKFIGSDGWIGNDGWRAELEASSQAILDEPISKMETQLYTCPEGEQRNFLDCVKSRKECYAPAETGHRTITIAHIGHIAMLLKRKLRWDPEKEEFIGDTPANWLLSRPMREPWTLAGLS
ncbi:MAG: Gfo/Idh/MocA family oxidoreductase [Candidatus Hinthialibacter antarcticus]|nr:Gfo/Idh/MocA family oxidoreductase [Candidatus Hinthialibacter antarcticus]